MPIKKNKISYTLDLKEQMDELEIKPSKRKQASEAVGNFLLGEMLNELSGERSPVQNGSYKKGLSKKYAEKKKAQGKGTKADLQLTDSMLGHLNIKGTKESVKLSITESTERKKAFNHNTPKGSGAPLPQRQFLPDDSKEQTFKKKITRNIEKVLKGFE